MHDSKTTAALGAILLLLVGGCNQPAPAAAEAALPEGETDLSCAALIFAATSLQQGEGSSGGDLGFGDGIAAVTRRGSADSESKGITGDEAFAQIKLEAYRMTGKVPGA